MPITIEKIKPWTVFSSKGEFSRFSSNINSARVYFHRHYNTFSYNRGRTQDDFVYYYRIEKYNLKKQNTKKKQKSSQGNKVVKREVVQEREVKLFVYRFPRKNVVRGIQHLRHFLVELKF